MVKRFPTMDAWTREAEEASSLIDDIESRVIKDKNPADIIYTEELYSLRDDSAKSKLLQLGIKLDRLESLLRNPPSKPILTDTDVNLRWKMLADIQLRTRLVALTLFAIPPIPRREDTKESDKSLSFDSNEAAASSLTKNHDTELGTPLILDDTTRNNTQNTRLGSFIMIVCMIFGAIGLLVALFVLCAMI